MPRPNNPYIVGKAIGDKEKFFGRQDIIEWVKNELINTETNALVLFGQRRIGKTSLLLQLVNELPTTDFLTVYFDLQDTSKKPLGKLLTDLAGKIAKRVNVQLPSNIKFFSNGDSFQQQFIPWVLEKIGKNKRLVLLLDEFDVLDKTIDAELPQYSASKSLLPFLRRLMRNEPRLAFVFVVGRHPNDLRTDYSATFKTSLFRQLWVLDESSAKKLIRLAERNNTLRFDNTSIDRILQLTNRHPYIMQLFCHSLWEFAHAETANEMPKIFVTDVNEIIPLLIETGTLGLNWLWIGLSPVERIYAAALAEEASENRYVTDRQIKTLLSNFSARLPDHEMDLAPDDLVERRVIEIMEDRSLSEKTYRFAIELFRLWVKENQPLSLVKEELDRMDEIAEQHFNVAYSYYRQNEWQSANDNFNKALQRNPRHLKATIYLGKTLFELGQLPKAMDYFKKAYHLDPQDAKEPLFHAWIKNSERRLQDEDTDNALLACKEALSLSPNDKTALNLQKTILVKHGDKFMEKHDWAFAISAYQKAGETDKIEQLKSLELPSHEWLLAGEKALSYQDKDAAQVAFEYAGELNVTELIRNTTDVVAACHKISRYYYEKQELEQAKKYLYHIIGLDQDNAINSILIIIQDQLLRFRNKADKSGLPDCQLFFKFLDEITELQSLAEIILPVDDTLQFQKLVDKKQLWDKTQNKNTIAVDLIGIEEFELLFEFVKVVYLHVCKKLNVEDATKNYFFSKANTNKIHNGKNSDKQTVRSVSSSYIEKIISTDTQLNIQFRKGDICLMTIVPGTVHVNITKNKSNIFHQPIINLNYTYWIGKYPITNKQYALFAKQHKFATRDSSNPVTNISWSNALNYCEWLENELNEFSKTDIFIVRLPDEVEWERAAKGSSTNSFPWGNEVVNDTLCNYANNNSGVTQVGIYSPQDNSPFGCSDMAGNVWEWTVSPYDETTIYHPMSKFDRKYTKRLVCKGGAWNFPKEYVKCSSRYKFLPNTMRENIGFRIFITKQI